jgi:hypothetical protein
MVVVVMVGRHVERNPARIVVGSNVPSVVWCYVHMRVPIDGMWYGPGYRHVNPSSAMLCRVIPHAVGIGSFNRDPTGSVWGTRSPLGRG